MPDESTSLALALPQPTSLVELKDLADMVSKSGLVPKEFRDKPGDCLIAIAMGAEVGLKWAAALQSIAVINGRPSIWGDAALGIVMSHPEFVSIDENESTDTCGVCILTRRGIPPRRREFSLEMARTAGLLNKDTYKQHQGQMLIRRARARCMADLFSDALKGLSLRENVEHVIEGEVVREDSPARSGAAAVKEKLAARKKPAEEAPAPAKAGKESASSTTLSSTGAVSIADVAAAYKRAKTPDDIRLADALGARLGTEPDKMAARTMRSARIIELSDTVDADTGEIKDR